MDRSNDTPSVDHLRAASIVWAELDFVMLNAKSLVLMKHPITADCNPYNEEVQLINISCCLSVWLMEDNSIVS